MPLQDNKDALANLRVRLGKGNDLYVSAAGQTFVGERNVVAFMVH